VRAGTWRAKGVAKSRAGSCAESNREEPVRSKPKSTTKKAAPKAAADSPKESVVVTSASKQATKHAAKEPREKAPKDDMMVFAFRLSKEESAAIHKAAGPGKASKFARTLLVAAARNDEAEVKAILKAVQTNA